ncbi:MAG: helix-turn-helix domain-containing protein [Pseudomonadota bacterium]|nr:helix-turn-helix domain-containing protein [Pseudomonadota bacterium]
MDDTPGSGAAFSMTAVDELQRQAEQFRASGLLGKPGALSRLFDFLLARSLAGEVPKEIEIALQVFGKGAGFDVAQDSVVRVYVHKLRRRLEEFAARSITPFDNRITIPKGEYRLVLEPTTAAAIENVAAPIELPPPVTSAGRQWLKPALLVVVAFIAGVALTHAFTSNPHDRELNAVRHSAVWAPLLDDDLPITLVVGDYFLLGEVDDANNVQRLVREFYVNSNQDFMEHMQLNPQLMRSYRNLGLTYLPAASAFALQDLVPVLNTGKPVRVTLLSALDPSVLKSTHVVYVGYLSGLGLLGDRVFAQSRIALGGSFDELHDTQTGTTYVSTVMPMGSEGGVFRDFGYFSTFAGPNGNRIVVISGTRDNGVMHVAEALSARAGVAELGSKAAGADSFESLYEIDGMARAGLNARLLFVASMHNDAIWSGAP